MRPATPRYAPVDERQAVVDSARPVLMRMALLSNGKVAALERSRGGESERVGPSGNAHPLYERWAERIASAPDAETARALLEAAEAELGAQLRRPLAPDTTETLDELMARIVQDGWGITAEECAVAMRCTPTLVRRARLEARRHPDTGYALPEFEGDVWKWARRLDQVGLSVRQIEALTALPKSTLHRRFA
jgi:DNA-binding IclR family transcriptional regulator